ncbi:MAG: hypothetical protein HY291_04890 [Planctomycetes bacterium]|nr:hypothetical protein [Planctomycetota bacterium]
MSGALNHRLALNALIALLILFPLFVVLTLVSPLTLFGAGKADAEGDRQRLFNLAQEHFDAAKSPEDFLQAATLYESILSGGYENGAICFDLGNAYMRAGRPGSALAAYRRAQRLLPRDPYVDANLRAALAALPDAPRLEGAGDAWWKRVFFWHASLAEHERLWFAAAAWAAAFLLAAVRLLAFPQAGRGRSSLGWGTLVTLAFSAVFSLSAGLGYQEEAQTRHGVVLRETTARKGNGESYAPAFDKAVKEGAEFIISEQRGEWLAVRFSGAGEAWVPAKDAVVY